MPIKTLFISFILIFFVVIVFIFKKKQADKKKVLTKQAEQKLPPSSSVEDFSGDNRCDTELDLAQAYFELHQHEEAKHLLKSVITHGEPHQVLEARKMFTLLLKQERSS